MITFTYLSVNVKKKIKKLQRTTLKEIELGMVPWSLFGKCKGMWDRKIEQGGPSKAIHRAAYSHKLGRTPFLGTM